MDAPNLKVPFSITYIGTATAIFHLDGISLLTDPVFSPANTKWDMGVVVLNNTESAALKVEDLPPFDAVLLSHEDHPDNLDDPGRLLLNGRHVFTTLDGAKNLGYRPGVRGLRPWETVVLEIGGKHLDITGTPCQHLPGGEVTGFIITAPRFGETNGLPNAIYFSGDTVYLDELVQMRNKFHISVAVLNIGKVMISLPDQELQITMDGRQAARLFRDIGADVLVPMHYESWRHFRENGTELRQAFEEENIMDKVCWLTPGETRQIV
ncbi:putative Zn-dependent hydrolases of the beta-lactamase protein [Lepidopterella palustris CBS 459.81]|uniref:Putative Zn-dependent hydrolases of the beta-lactamase protein n=1 Tax=Lepidopterella palustris CBS 459.81 TaxID=1314670 RepID=A0A8E2J9N4_9PEZI|nr:putative Zn-dependent hydrolases of the beta-lactamase protein [Lepidopterella palustris CBS 459.81]